MNNNCEKLVESAEIARLTDEYLARGGKIEYIPYVTPDAATVKQLGFMRKFKRENEYGI